MLNSISGGEIIDRFIGIFPAIDDGIDLHYIPVGDKYISGLRFDGAEFDHGENLNADNQHGNRREAEHQSSSDL